jgi:AraC family transcriptional regulator, regulatory protein of adaptative response / DNA-3-methyladenine glycosylase II
VDDDDLISFIDPKRRSRATDRMVPMVEDFERCYRAVLARDPRFDGWFVTAVTSTHVYCRPSCPARTPARHNVGFYRSAAAAQQAGFRACKRCRPDASPGSPEWNVRQDVVARAMRLIREGVVDRDGVSGLARRLGYSQRQLGRLLSAEVGAGPLALARAQRAQTARILVETTDLPSSSVAFAAGFASVRQFNDTFKQVFACTPTDLRRKRRDTASRADTLVLRLAHRQPHDATRTFAFLAARAIPGIELGTADRYARALTLPHGSGVVELTPGTDHVRAVLRLDDLRDLTFAVQRGRLLLDLDADPAAVAELLEADPVIGVVARRTPGIRVPGSVDPHELAIRAVVGQQISVAAARQILARLTAEHGTSLAAPHPTAIVTPAERLTHRFPAMTSLAALDPDRLPLPRRRASTLVKLAGALADGSVQLDPGEDAEAMRWSLRRIPGMGAWTADYIAVRALGHPDVLMPSDLGVRRAMAGLGLPSSPRAIDAMATHWRPWRSYAMFHVWGHHQDVRVAS